MYSILHEIFQNTLLYAAKDQHFEQTTSNNQLCTKVSSQQFYSLSQVLFFENFLNKVPGLLFIFVCVSMGLAHFQKKRYAFLGSHKVCYGVFISYEMSENTTRKAGFKVCEESLDPVFNSEKKTAFKQKLTCA